MTRQPTPPASKPAAGEPSVLRSACLALARMAADKRRARREPLTRREALAEAPWSPELAEGSGVIGREWRSAYADRLIERGLALPSSNGRSGSSGPSLPEEERATERVSLRLRPGYVERLRWLARSAGCSAAAWVERAIDKAVA